MVDSVDIVATLCGLQRRFFEREKSDIDMTTVTNTSGNILSQPRPRRRRRPNVLVTGTPGTGKTTLAAMIVERLNQMENSMTNDDDANIQMDDDDDDDVILAKHINVGEIIKTYQFYDGYDAELETHILDEDQLIDHLDEIFIETLRKTQAATALASDENEHENYSVSLIADYHICEIFPERYFDLVLVLRTDTELLYDRYIERNYHHTPTNSNHSNNCIPNHSSGTTITAPPMSSKITQNLQCEIMNVIYEHARQSYASEIVVEVPSNTIEDMDSNVERVVQWIQLWMNHNNNDDDESEP